MAKMNMWTGQKEDDAEPAKITATEEAQQQLAARQATDPQMAELQYGLIEKYLPQFTQLQETTRQNVLPGESAVRDQLVKNILANLISPKGITPQQQTAIGARRGIAQDQLVQAMRERQNLGNNLFGGRGQRAEQRAVGELQNQFLEEDINREERAGLNAIQAAIPLLQVLFPGINITSPNFQTAVASPDTTYQGAVSQSNTQATNLANQKIAQDQLLASIFSGLGKASAAAIV